MTAGTAGQPLTFSLAFYSESTGQLTDPASVTLDITYGEEVGFAPDYAGPFYYSGASSPAAGQVYRTGTGLYAFLWNIPGGAPQGVYTANWTCSYGGSSFLGVENFTVTGGVPLAVPSGDTGYWTGSIAYTPPAGSFSQYSAVTIPLGSTDANGITWTLLSAEGWDGTDIQGPGSIPRAGDHGGWPSGQFLATRVVTLTILASAPTQALRDLARSLLQEACPVSDLALFTYDEPVPKQAQVRMSGRITEACPTLADVIFTVPLAAPDPRKYAVQGTTASTVTPSQSGAALPWTLPVTLPAQAPGGAVSVTNAGNFETRPLVTVTGPITSPAIQNVNTGQVVSFTGLVLGSADSLAVDFSARQASLDGSYRPADVTSSWWVLPPGTTTIQLGGSGSAGSAMSVQFASAWK